MVSYFLFASSYIHEITLPKLVALINAGYHSIFLLVSLQSMCFWDAEKNLLLAYKEL